MGYPRLQLAFTESKAIISDDHLKFSSISALCASFLKFSCRNLSVGTGASPISSSKMTFPISEYQA
jgi:hypothetical protein